MDFQPTLIGPRVGLFPLEENDFNALYEVAKDPLIWEMHPNPDRWQEPVFRRFFEGAMRSGGAFKIVHLSSKKLIGCTRFYDYDAEQNEILIGYTFFSRSVWGDGYNMEVKRLMLAYAFQFVESVVFHIGSKNFRSQKSIVKIGAEEEAEIPIAYYGEEPKMNIVYKLKKSAYQINERSLNGQN